MRRRLDVTIEDYLVDALDDYCAKRDVFRSELFSIWIKRICLGQDDDVKRGKLPEKSKVQAVAQPLSKLKLEEQPGMESLTSQSSCQNHSWDKKLYMTKHLSYVDKSGIRLWTRRLCTSCEAQMRRHAERSGGVLRKEKGPIP